MVPRTIKWPKFFKIFNVNFVIVLQRRRYHLAWFMNELTMNNWCVREKHRFYSTRHQQLRWAGHWKTSNKYNFCFITTIFCWQSWILPPCKPADLFPLPSASRSNSVTVRVLCCLWTQCILFLIPLTDLVLVNLWNAKHMINFFFKSVRGLDLLTIIYQKNNNYTDTVPAFSTI